jgi:hypothetical protein
VSILRFEIRYAHGRKEAATVEGDRVLIGSGAHCDVRLPLDQAANEHVAVEVVGNTVRAETKAFNPPVTVNGAPFANGVIAPNVPIAIGSTLIYVALGVGYDGSPVLARKTGDETSPFMKVLGVLVLVAGAYMMFSGGDAPTAPPPAKAPDLFPVSGAPTCPMTSSDQALAFASDKFDIAEGKRERSPFSPREGLDAVGLYDLAAACFQRAGDSARAEEATSAAHQLRTAITQDFRARRLRLEHLMEVGDYELARKDVTVLRSYSEGKTGPWVNWLANTAQIVKQRAGAR